MPHSKESEINIFPLDLTGEDQILETKEEVKAYHNDLMGALKKNTTLQSFGYPTWDDTHSYVTDRVYSDIMSIPSILSFMNDILGKDDPETYFKASSTDNLYSFWLRGELPLEVYRRFRLEEAHVDAVDFAKLTSEQASLSEINDDENED